MTQKQDEILQTIQSKGEPMTAREIAEAIYGQGKHQSIVFSTLQTLVSQGNLEKTGSVQPFAYGLPTVRAFQSPQSMRAAPKQMPTVSKESMTSLPTPSREQVEKYLTLWASLENYTMQEKALDRLFLRLCPANKDIEDVLLKAAVLNDFYSTNIYSIYPVARHIVALDMDERLSAGDAALVNDIEKVVIGGKAKYFYSFATKYCSHHRPALFPIYDSYVDRVLRYFRDRDRFSQFHNADLKNYAVFKQTIMAFQRYYQLDGYGLKDVDRYLWQLGKAYFSKYTE